MADETLTGSGGRDELDLNAGGDAVAPETFVVEAGSSDAVTLPEGFNFGDAKFEPSGSDLILTSPDGKEVVIQDYYEQDPAPDLHTPSGGELAGSTVVRLAEVNSPTQGQVAQAAPSADAQPIGQVESVSGTVTAIRADGTRVELQVGDPVYQGDVMQSSADGSVGVVLADETTFSMAENGRMVLDEMVYDPGTQEGSISMSVLQGVFTFVSGQVAKVDPDAMVLKTPVATIGIRGTQVGIDLSGDDPEGMKVVLMEESDGFVGEVVISNNAGIQILNLPDQGANVSSSNDAPTQPRVYQRDEVSDSFRSALESLPTEVGTGNDYGTSNTNQDQEEETEQDVIDEQAEGDEDLAEFETAAGDEGGEEEFAEGVGDEDIIDEQAEGDEDLAEFETAAGEEGGEEEFAEGVGDEDVIDEQAEGNEDLAEFETAAGDEEGVEEEFAEGASDGEVEDEFAEAGQNTDQGTDEGNEDLDDFETASGGDDAEEGGNDETTTISTSDEEEELVVETLDLGGSSSQETGTTTTNTSSNETNTPAPNIIPTAVADLATIEKNNN